MTTKTTAQFLTTLRQKNISFWADGDQLRYKAPKGAFTPEIMAEVRQRKAEILHLCQQATQGKTQQRVRRFSAETAPPLSLAQQRLWFLEHLHGASSTYNIAGALRLQGDLNVTALAQSLTHITSRHATLRTTFSEGDNAVQLIAPPTKVVLEIESITASDLPTRLETEAQRPFDIFNETLFRAHLFQINSTSHVLLLNFHHIITDGQSIELFNQELATCYSAFCQEKSPVLSRLPVQYSDFSASQRDWMAAGQYSEQLGYWERQLQGAPDLIALPLDHARPPVQTFAGASYSTTLTDLSALQTMAQEAGTSKFVVVQTALSAFLSRYCGTEDVLTGFSVANRNLPEIEALIGFFVNTVVLRVDCSADATFKTLVNQVRNTVLDALENQAVPFEQVVQTLDSDRDMSYPPLVQVMVSWLDGARSLPELAGVMLTPMETGFAPARFDLTLEVYESAETLQFIWLYNRDLFEATTIERWANNFSIFLNTALQTPDLTVENLPLISSTERVQLLEQWNQTSLPYAAEANIVQRFEDQVAQTPDAIAIAFADETLTYRAVNDRANQLAHYLIEQGIVSESLVGICLERSPRLLIGILGILKAGGAYVPLDPAYPVKRLNYIVENSQANWVIGSTQTASLFDFSGTLINMDQIDAVLPQYAAENIGRLILPAHLAYILYTSGSTGLPKGVAIEHRGPQALIHWAQTAFSKDELQGVLASTSVCFDLSVYEIFLPLSVGGSIILVQDLLHLPTNRLRDQITLINTVPSVMQQLLTHDELPACVKVINLAGEPLKNHLVQRLYAYPQVQKVWDLYGPSEDTTYSTAYLTLEGTTKNPYIGRPIHNTQAYILTKQLQPVPIGVIGELCLAGDGIARGYWNKAELSAEKFLPNPFGEGYLYKTGDECRYLSDGNIEYIGRIDHQVKLRGFRIELGEIESVLFQHPDVNETIVIMRDDYLIAYIVGEVTPQALREHLKKSVPDYMIPAYFVTLDAMPLSPNGKIDRKQLPERDLATPESDRPIRYHSPLEEGVAHIWETVLQRDRIHPQANFFDLGGHSLLAMQLIARVRTVYEVAVSVKALFEAPTIAALSAHIADKLQEGHEPLPPILPLDPASSYRLSITQQRLWVLHQIEAQRAAYNVPVALKFEGSLNHGALENSFQKLIARHAVLRTGFERIDDLPMQLIASEIAFSLPLVPLTEAAVEQYIAAEMRRPFDLSAPPLLRATLLQLDPQTHILILTIHHIITDGWSLNLLMDEVAQYYTDATLSLPPLPLRYVDYAAWQQTTLTHTTLQPQLAYWREQLANLPPQLELPTDRPRPVVQGSNGRIHYFSFDKTLTRALKQTAREQNVTLFMLLLAGYGTLLSRYSNQTDIAIGSGIANRTRPEIESLLGFFVNTLVMRVRTEGNPRFSDLLAQVRQMSLEAYAHQDVPFEQLVDMLQPDRNMSHAPLFQTIFTLQNLPPMDTIDLPNLVVSGVSVPESVAKLDLTVLMWESAEKLTGTLEYNADIFDTTTIERFVSHFETLLSALVAAIETPIFEFNLLPDAEKIQLASWNKTAATYPTAATISDLFANQVSAHPNNRAVIFGATELTYRDLDQRANQVAAALLERGVSVGDTVAIVLGRSHEMIAAILGILKVGATYVPVDPEYPPDRRAYMLTDCGTQLVITDNAHDALLSSELPRFDIATIQTQPTSPIEVAFDPQTPAYIIYTSGSTGQPKGCVVTHQNVVRLLYNDANPFQFGAQDVWVVAHSFCFDFSVWEMYGALLYGGAVVIAERETVRDPNLFLGLLQREKVTVLNQTPAGFYNLVSAEKHTPPTLHNHLHTVIFGGDRLEPTYLQEWADRYPLDQIRLVNMYGITETTVHVTHHTLTEADVWGEGGRSPIGRPLPETEVYILNEALQQQPVGVIGEIYVTGTGVSNGYLNKPDLTSTRFVNLSLNGENRRVYRSGDLGRWLSDGTLEHFGRNDFQVQIRGFRIELGEIETAAAHHPAIEKCITVAKGSGTDTHLVSYLIPNQTVAPTLYHLAQLNHDETRKTITLPNGMTICHLNNSETAFIYAEIVTDNSYFKHGITLQKGAVVFDVGANIGLFSLHATQQAPAVTVYAFEPIPQTYDCLATNAALYSENIIPIQQGIAEQPGEATFHYYPHASVLSGQFAGTEDEREVVKQFLTQQGETDRLDELLDARLQTETVVCQLTTISAELRTRQIEQIDLLKVDVEKGELSVLSSILPEDWAKIRQIVIEVHDENGRLNTVTTLLEQHGFNVVAEQDADLETTGLYNIYGRRPAQTTNGTDKSAVTMPLYCALDPVLEQVKTEITQRLPSYMLPNAFVWLTEIPLTSNGKIDRKALPEPQQRGKNNTSQRAPTSEIEQQIATIWEEVLDVASISLDDDFFMLGGHSLNATQVIARIQQRIGADIPLTTLFESPTIEALAEAVETVQWAASETDMMMDEMGEFGRL